MLAFFTGVTLGARASRARALDLRRRQRRGDGTATRGALRLATKPRRPLPTPSHPTYRPRVAQLRRITAIAATTSYRTCARTRGDKRRPAEDPSGLRSSCAEPGAILALTTPLSHYFDHAIPSNVLLGITIWTISKARDASRPPCSPPSTWRDRRRARVVKGCQGRHPAANDAPGRAEPKRSAARARDGQEARVAGCRSRVPSGDKPVNFASRRLTTVTVTTGGKANVTSVTSL